ncbi:Uncharacterised protein [Candidatus Anstonella stagnisolia]|nr:Uncharacterised protein [Candidatus Anstonella stagnisolia]
MKIAFCILCIAAACIAATNYVGRGADDVCFAGLGGRAQWIAMAFMLTIALIALAYMFAKATENEAAGVWAHEEMFGLGISVAVVAGMVALTIGSCEVLSAYSQSPEISGIYADQNPFLVSYTYLNDLSNNGLWSIEAQTKDSLKKQLDATEFLYVGVPVIKSKGIPTKASLKALSTQKEMVIDMMLPLVVSLKAQKGVLQLIEIAGMAVMLPFAIILRIIPFTRSAGNIMLAVVFGLFVVVPATYVLSAYAWRGIGQNSVLMGGDFSFKDRAIGDACGEADCQLYQIGSLIPQAVFIPNLVIVVATTCVMGLSKALQALTM